MKSRVVSLVAVVAIALTTSPTAVAAPRAPSTEPPTAVSVSLLQAQSPSITGLSKATEAAIGGIATGDLEKVILRYDKQWSRRQCSE